MDASTLFRRVVDRPAVVDGAIALVLTAMAQVQAGSATPLVDRLLLAVMTGVVTIRRILPLTTALVVSAAAAAMALTPQQPSVFGEYLAIMLVSYTVAERCRLSVAVLGGLALAGGIVLHDLAAPDLGDVGSIAGDLVTPALAWGVGRIVHFQNRRTNRAQQLVAQLERDRAELARMAVEAERRHIARELHDVVTHSVSVVVVQAQGAQRVLQPDQPQVRQSLQDIEAAGRTALTEMRRLLGLLREEGEPPAHAPQPGLADIPALVDRVRGAGVDVRCTESGPRSEIGAGAELSAYRVVQEALTNSVKYAQGAQVFVELRHLPDALEIAVTDGGGDPTTDQSGGRGLLGMRERVAVFGGTLTAGPQPSGGFRVCAKLPAVALGGRASDPPQVAAIPPRADPIAEATT